MTTPKGSTVCNMQTVAIVALLHIYTRLRIAPPHVRPVVLVPIRHKLSLNTIAGGYGAGMTSPHFLHVRNASFSKKF